MTTFQQTWAQHVEPFTATVGDVEDWDAASPCEGWSAAEVLAHVIDTQRDFLRERGHELPPLSAREPVARWAEHAGAVDALLTDPAVAAAPFEGFFGPTTIGEALLRFYGFDLLVHRWDLARSQGRDVTFTEGELSEIDAAVDGYGEAAYMPGVFAQPVEVADGASEQERVLARTGRRG